MRLITGMTIALLGIIYLGMFSFASEGYGYSGYDGYDSGPSFWYFGGPRYFPNRSVRNGSIGGPGDRGAGIHYGK